MGDTGVDVFDLQAIVTRLSKLEKEFQDVKNNTAELILYNSNLKKAMCKLKMENDSLLDNIYDMEVDITDH